MNLSFSFDKTELFVHRKYTLFKLNLYAISAKLHGKKRQIPLIYMHLLTAEC